MAPETAAHTLLCSLGSLDQPAEKKAMAAMPATTEIASNRNRPAAALASPKEKQQQRGTGLSRRCRCRIAEE
jgi:hypothetical protein